MLFHHVTGVVEAAPQDREDEAGKPPTVFQNVQARTFSVHRDRPSPHPRGRPAVTLVKHGRQLPWPQLTGRGTAPDTSQPIGALPWEGGPWTARFWTLQTLGHRRWRKRLGWGAALFAIFTHSLSNILLHTYCVPASGDSVVTKTGKTLYLRESDHLTGRAEQ